MQDVAEHLAAGADLGELKEAAQDLRALSPNSVLAELVEEKIERIHYEAHESWRKVLEGACSRLRLEAT
jgi:hypothetical protein